MSRATMSVPLSRDDFHIHLAMLIGQRPIVGTKVKSKSDKLWQK